MDFTDDEDKERDFGGKEYLKLLEDDDESDNDTNWKRASSSSSDKKTPNSNCPIQQPNQSNSNSLRGSSVSRNINFDEELLNKPIIKTVRPIVTSSLRTSDSPPQSSLTKTEPIWSRITFPKDKSKSSESPPASRCISVSFASSSSISPLKDSFSSKLVIQKKPIASTMNHSSYDVRIRLGPDMGDKKLPERPPIPDTLDIKPIAAPPKQRFNQQDNCDMDTFVQQIKTEMIFHRSLDRIYNRSLRELTTMKKNPEFPSLIKLVIEGLLFDPEVIPDSETVHKILKILANFELDNTNTWNCLIDQCFTLIKNNELHHERLAKFIEMSFNHLFSTKTRLLPETALSLFKMAQVPPFDPKIKPSTRIQVANIKSNLTDDNPGNIAQSTAPKSSSAVF